MTISIRKLNKTYGGKVHALRNISLELKPGMFGLLGPNGAGKSTLMRTLATLQQPDSGEVWFNDINLLQQPQVVRQQLGYLPQEFGVYPKVSAWNLLEHFAVLKGVFPKKKRLQMVEDLLVRTNLYDVRHRAVSSFSGGMVRRWGIAQALLGDPKLVIVDEPTAGLDPEERVRFHNLLSDISERVVVVFSTHMVNDVLGLCSRMAIMNQGRLLLTGSPQRAIGLLHGKIWKKQIAKQEVAAYRERYQLVSTNLVMGKTQIRIYAHHPPGGDFDSCDATLEDVYFTAIAGYLALEEGA